MNELQKTLNRPYPPPVFWIGNGLNIPSTSSMTSSRWPVNKGGWMRPRISRFKTPGMKRVIALHTHLFPALKPRDIDRTRDESTLTTYTGTLLPEADDACWRGTSDVHNLEAGKRRIRLAIPFQRGATTSSDWMRYRSLPANGSFSFRPTRSGSGHRDCQRRMSHARPTRDAQNHRSAA